MTASGARATTSPSARSTNSFRTRVRGALAASGARSGLTTSWQTPVSSRRSTKTSPPWSRRRAAQPASVTRSPTCSRRGPRRTRRSRQLIEQLRERRAGHLAIGAAARSRRRAARSVAPSASTDEVPRARALRLRELALQRAARVVGVAARRPARGARPSAAEPSRRSTPSSKAKKTSMPAARRCHPGLAREQAGAARSQPRNRRRASAGRRSPR